jgi:hypothetical protein
MVASRELTTAELRVMSHTRLPQVYAKPLIPLDTACAGRRFWLAGAAEVFPNGAVKAWRHRAKARDGPFSLPRCNLPPPMRRAIVGYERALAQKKLLVMVAPAAAAAACALAARAAGAGRGPGRGRGRLVVLEGVSVQRPFAPL